MQEIPDTYDAYVRKLRAGEDNEGVDSQARFIDMHFSILRRAFGRVKQVTTEKEKESAVKIVTALSKRVLKEPFSDACKPFIMGTLFHLPTDVFASFRKDPYLHQFITDNASALYVQAIGHSSPGVPSILRKKYRALLPADNEKWPVTSHLNNLGYPSYENMTVAGHFLYMPLNMRGPDLSMFNLNMKYTPEDFQGLCEEFVYLYEDFIKGEGRRARSLPSLCACSFVDVFRFFCKKNHRK
jgi:hypothetical protein